jgi:hypothetical protein
MSFREPEHGTVDGEAESRDERPESSAWEEGQNRGARDECRGRNKTKRSRGASVEGPEKTGSVRT